MRERYIWIAAIVLSFVSGWSVGRRPVASTTSAVDEIKEQQAAHFAKIRENWAKAPPMGSAVTPSAPSGSSSVTNPGPNINWIPAIKLPPPDPNEPDDPSQ